MQPDLEARLRHLLGPNLQTGALRAVLALGAFSAIGAFLAWMVI